MQRTEGLPAIPPVPSAPAPKKKSGKAVKIVAIIVGGLVVLGTLGALAGPQEVPTPVVAETEAAPAPIEPEPTEAPGDQPGDSIDVITPEPEFTAGQENAIATAKSYLDVGGFSKTSLIDQLE